ncbi:GtrA family protein [Rhizobium sp. ARZ01]|uniref:GtrA family protein n=1 Tax=Rhizobium sp. ARZ01 TaxID=2769313 RepID=UPI001783702C|nr:GtrA family protein [Rhizobium sp. ARZ01]MBD9371907.1 GtrA family protein [Rhizobium sp. ARZ01]
MTNPQLQIKKIIRFTVVGVGNTIVDFAVFSLALILGMATLPANGIAWAIAVGFSYAVNSFWSFHRTRRHRQAIPRFLVSGAVISLCVSSLGIWVLAPLLGVWPAKIAGTIGAAVLNFFAARWSIESRIA